MTNRRPPSIITIAVLTTITIVFWIFFSVYQILTGEIDVDVPPELLRPINPTLNQEILNTIGNGRMFEKEEVIHFSSEDIEDLSTNQEDDASLLEPTNSELEDLEDTEISTQSAELSEQ